MIASGRHANSGRCGLQRMALEPVARRGLRSAAAIEYPWCAQYGGEDGGGGRNCGFVTCMETVRGIGESCEHNLFYTGPEERPVRHSRRHNDD